MIAQTRAELLKIRSTRTTIGLVLGMLALVVLFALLSGLLTKTHDLTTKEDQLGLLGVGSFAGVFSALAGIMLVTSEYRYGTIRPTFLFTPRRSRVLAAKLGGGLSRRARLRRVGRAARVRDRLRSALRARRCLRPQRRRRCVARAGNDRRRRDLGRDRRRARRDRPKPGRRDHRASSPGASSSRTSSSPSYLRSDGSARSTHKTPSPGSRPGTSSRLPPAAPS